MDKVIVDLLKARGYSDRAIEKAAARRSLLSFVRDKIGRFASTPGGGKVAAKSPPSVKKPAKINSIADVYSQLGAKSSRLGKGPGGTTRLRIQTTTKKFNAMAKKTSWEFSGAKRTRGGGMSKDSGTKKTAGK